jgi:hypothetical protein
LQFSAGQVATPSTQLPSLLHVSAPLQNRPSSQSALDVHVFLSSTLVPMSGQPATPAAATARAMMASDDLHSTAWQHCRIPLEPL